MHAFRDLEARDLALQCGDDALLGQRVSGLRDDNGRDGFAEVGIRYADDRRLDDSGQRVEPLLDFLRVDVEAAADDQVLGATNDAQARTSSPLTSTIHVSQV